MYYIYDVKSMTRDARQAGKRTIAPDVAIKPYRLPIPPDGVDQTRQRFAHQLAGEGKVLLYLKHKKEFYLPPPNGDMLSLWAANAAQLFKLRREPAAGTGVRIPV